MPRVNHFEIPAEDPERAKKFFEKTFDWKIEKWDGPMDYWLVMTGEGPGIDGGIVRKEDTPMIRNTINVSDIDAFAEKVKENGGKLLSEKMHIDGVGYFVIFQDTEGNVHGMMQDDKKGK